MILQVGVKAFLRNTEGKYLLVKRNTEKYQTVRGLWDIVGGRIESGTTLLENLKREVQEETRLEIISEPKLVFVQDIIRAPEKHVVRLTYIADTRGEVSLDTTENCEYRWLSISEIQAEKDLDVYVKEIVEKNILLT